jgi:hypothetical protein
MKGSGRGGDESTRGALSDSSRLVLRLRLRENAALRPGRVEKRKIAELLRVKLAERYGALESPPCSPLSFLARASSKSAKLDVGL